MKTFHNPLHAAHAGRQEMFRGRMVPCHEVPERLDFVLAELRRRPMGELLEPEVDNSALDTAIARVHDPRYTTFLAGAWDEWVAMDPANAQRDALPSVWPLPGRHAFRTDVLPGNFAARLGLFGFDSGTPLMAGTWAAARMGAACAVSAAQAVLAGDRAAFALTRPPGHHAGPDFFGGYCFLNNAAIAAQTLRDAGHARVAVLDIDYHHGNGTQTIFYERPDVLTVSIHGDPRTEYPFFLGHADERGAGAGEGHNLNLPCREAPISSPGARHSTTRWKRWTHSTRRHWWYPWDWTPSKAIRSRASGCAARITTPSAACWQPPACRRCSPSRVAMQWPR
jgi:acetoin utilization deacetylase AcuC-like enzyme